MITINIIYKDGSTNQHEFAKGLSDKELTKIFQFLEGLLTVKIRSIRPDGTISREF